MKTTMVPAQVTTVEDKIAGNLSLQQLLMLVSPLFISAALYAFMPPFIKFTPLKVFIGTVIFVLFATMAIRIKGKLLIEWIAIRARYNVRPKHYVYNKNDSYLRPESKVIVELEEKTQAEGKKHLLPHLPSLSAPELIRINEIITDPRANFNFKTRKGKLNVHITEIK